MASYGHSGATETTGQQRKAAAQVPGWEVRAEAHLGSQLPSPSPHRGLCPQAGSTTDTRRRPQLRCPEHPGTPRCVLTPSVTQDLVTSSTPRTAATAPAPAETAGQACPPGPVPPPPGPVDGSCYRPPSAPHLGPDTLVSQPRVRCFTPPPGHRRKIKSPAAIQTV